MVNDRSSRETNRGRTVLLVSLFTEWVISVTNLGQVLSLRIEPFWSVKVVTWFGYVFGFFIEIKGILV